MAALPVQDQRQGRQQESRALGDADATWPARGSAARSAVRVVTAARLRAVDRQAPARPRRRQRAPSSTRRSSIGNDEMLILVLGQRGGDAWHPRRDESGASAGARLAQLDLGDVPQVEEVDRKCAMTGPVRSPVQRNIAPNSSPAPNELSVQGRWRAFGPMWSSAKIALEPTSPITGSSAPRKNISSPTEEAAASTTISGVAQREQHVAQLTVERARPLEAVERQPRREHQHQPGRQAAERSRRKSPQPGPGRRGARRWAARAGCPSRARPRPAPGRRPSPGPGETS